MKSLFFKRYAMVNLAPPAVWVVLILSLIPVQTSAHSLFIQSGRYHVKAGKGSPLFFCYGHHFPVDDAVRRKKLEYVRIINPDMQVRDIVLREEKSLHSYVVQYEKSGTYVLTAETRPGYFAQYIDKKGRKRHSLKPLHAFIDNAQTVTSSMRSSQWTKAYVVCDEAGTSFPAEVGLPMELLPEKNPSLVKMGETITFQVHNDGKPYKGDGFYDATYSGFSTESEDMYIPETPVKNGVFTVPVDMSGRWFVRFFTKVNAPEDKQKEYLTEKRTTTLTFEIRNERKRPKTSDN